MISTPVDEMQEDFSCIFRKSPTKQVAPKNIIHPLFSEEDADLRGVAWTKDRNGYARVTRDGVCYLAHRIVLSRKLGRALREDELCDHQNRKPIDCQRNNLKLVDYQGNAQNRSLQRNNKTGYRGVRLARDGRYFAVVGARTKFNRTLGIHCGTFDTAEEADSAARKMRANLGFNGEPGARPISSTCNHLRVQWNGIRTCQCVRCGRIGRWRDGQILWANEPLLSAPTKGGE